MNNLSWLLYFGDVVSSLGCFLVIITIVIGISLLGAGVAFVMCEDDCEHETAAQIKNYAFRRILPMFLIVGVLCNLLPSKETIYLIAASEVGETVIKSPTGQKAIDAVNRYLDDVANPKKSDSEKEADD